MNNTNYPSSEQIHVGDGTGLSMKHIGSSSFYSPFNSTILSLTQLLHGPLIAKNLFSVSKFPTDNDVQDRVTNQVLIAMRLKEGLYVFDPPNFLDNLPQNPHQFNVPCSPMWIPQAIMFSY